MGDCVDTMSDDELREWVTRCQFAQDEAAWRPLTKEDWFAMGRDGIGVMNLLVRVVEDSKLPRERPIVWPVGCIPIKDAP